MISARLAIVQQRYVNLHLEGNKLYSWVFWALWASNTQMPVCEQEFAGSTLRTTRVNFLGARGIEAVIVIDHTRGNQVALRWLLYDGHGNLVRTMAPDYTLSAFQWRGVWGEVQGSLGVGCGYCANLGHPEDETGLVYMRARYYEPATGRFISEDPARDGMNWYLYAEGNPVNKVDSRGEVSESVAWFNAFLTALLFVSTAQASPIAASVVITGSIFLLLWFGWARDDALSSTGADPGSLLLSAIIHGSALTGVMSASLIGRLVEWTPVQRWISNVSPQGHVLATAIAYLSFINLFITLEDLVDG